MRLSLIAIAGVTGALFTESPWGTIAEPEPVMAVEPNSCGDKTVRCAPANRS